MESPELDRKRLKFYARHFASLEGVTYMPERRAETERAFCISGFVVSISELWFFITAGHVLDEVREVERNGQIIEGWALDCSYSMDAKDSYSTPFDLNGAAPQYVHEEQSGLDYAFIHLRPLVRWNLEANGLTALDERAWRTNLPDEFDEYILLGIAAEFVSYDAKAGTVEKVLNVAPLDKLNKVPEGAPLKEGLFYARIHDVPDGVENIPQSIVGMSGGPILGIRHSEVDTRYWVVAVQSWWDKNTRTVRACYVKALCESIEREIKDVLDELKQKNS